jgi:hypothetical protein
MIAAECLYIWCMMLIKLALGMFFLRIVIDQRQRQLIIFMISLSWVIGVAYFLFAVFQCGIPNGNGVAEWLTRISGQCISNPSVVEGISYTQTILNIVTDISFLLIPIPTLRESKLPHREKMIVIGIFAVATW